MMPDMKLTLGGTLKTGFFRPVSGAMLAICASLAIAVSLTSSLEASEGQKTTVAPGETIEIEAHGVCRRVSNVTTNPSAMVPHRSAQEWVPGEPHSFLANVPEGMTAVDCTSPEIALREWARPGPPGMTGQPFAIAGNDHSLTFQSVSGGMAGSQVSLSGNTISYTPSPESWKQPYLGEMTDVVSFTATDAQNVTVSGTLNLNLVGFFDDSIARRIVTYTPEGGGGLAVVPFGNSQEDIRFQMVYYNQGLIFDENFYAYGLFESWNRESHVILIDNSAASLSSWHGTPVGDLNGDGNANTILDAQIDAAMRFVEILVNDSNAHTSGVSLDANYEYYQNGQIINSASTLSVFSSSNIIENVNVYAVSNTLEFVGTIGNGTTGSDILTEAQSVLGGITANGSTLNLPVVFSSLETAIEGFIADTFMTEIHLFSPGVTTGAIPNLNRFHQTSAGNFGAPVHAYFTGSNPASTEGQLMLSLDRRDEMRHLSDLANFQDLLPGDTLIVNVVPYYNSEPIFDWNDPPWMRYDNGAVFWKRALPHPDVHRGVYMWAIRTVPGQDTTCRRLYCSPDLANPDILTGFDDLNALTGSQNWIGIRFEIWKSPLYRVHNDTWANSFNDFGLLGINGGFLNIQGFYTPSPP